MTAGSIEYVDPLTGDPLTGDPLTGDDQTILYELSIRIRNFLGKFSRNIKRTETE
jgi:hypothetical protein